MTHTSRLSLTHLLTPCVTFAPTHPLSFCHPFMYFYVLSLCLLFYSFRHSSTPSFNGSPRITYTYVYCTYSGSLPPIFFRESNGRRHCALRTGAKSRANVQEPACAYWQQSSVQLRWSCCKIACTIVCKVNPNGLQRQ